MGVLREGILQVVYFTFHFVDERDACRLPAPASTVWTCAFLESWCRWGCLWCTHHFTLLTKGMLADCQPQQVPCGPALFWRAGVSGGVPGQGGLVAAGQSAAAAGGQRP